MERKAFYGILLAGVFAGLTGIFVKNMTISASSIAWLRTGVPALFTMAWMFYAKVPFFRGNYKKMLLASLMNTTRIYFYFIAFIYTSIGNAVILFYTWPIFSAILAAIFIQERLRGKQYLYLGLAFCGILLAYSNQSFSFDDRDFIGMLAAVISSIIYAGTVIIFKTETKNYKRNEIIFYQNITGFIVFLPFFFFINEAPLVIDWVLGTSYATLIGIVGFNLFFFGLKYLKASIASALMYMEVVSAIIISYLWYGDFISWQMLVGGLLIIISSFAIQRK